MSTNDALGQITAILSAAGEGNPLDTLLPLVHADLRRLARAQRRQMEPGETLSTTALVNEAYLKLRRADYPNLANRAHFFSRARDAADPDRPSRLSEQKRMVRRARIVTSRWTMPRSCAIDRFDSALDELEGGCLAQVVLYHYFASYYPPKRPSCWMPPSVRSIATGTRRAFLTGTGAARYACSSGGDAS